MPDKQAARRCFLRDNTFYIAMLLALFTILFGTRHLDATERHEGLVAAIAFESVVKLLAFVAVGLFVTFWMYDGFGDIFERARAAAQLRRCSRRSRAWTAATTRLGLAHHPLDGRDHVPAAPVPGDGRGEHATSGTSTRRSGSSRSTCSPSTCSCCRSRSAGLLHFPAGIVDADTFVLTMPMAEKQALLALFAFIGGLSAATGMVIVETIALSTMVCNDLVMPALLRMRRLRLNERRDLSGLLLGIRRGAIVLILVLGYLYFRLAGEAYALVSIGLISFAAVAQFAPAISAASSGRGARAAARSRAWSPASWSGSYTLLLPSFARSGWLPITFLDAGPVRASSS